MESDTVLGDPALAAAMLDEYDEPTPSEDASLPLDRYLDREVGWLAFNQRVLELAEDPHVPLLERANFLAIFASNLDEFFMVRVAGLKRRIATGIAVPTNVGPPPPGVPAATAPRAPERRPRPAAFSRASVKPPLDEADTHVEPWGAPDAPAGGRMREIFSRRIFPVLMPL